MNKNNQSQSDDKWIYRISVVVLGLVAIAAAGFLAWSRPRTEEDA